MKNVSVAKKIWKLININASLPIQLQYSLYFHFTFKKYMFFIVCIEQLDLPCGYKLHPLGQLSTLKCMQLNSRIRQKKVRGARDTSINMQNKCLCSHFHIKGQYIVIVKNCQRFFKLKYDSHVLSKENTKQICSLLEKLKI